MKIWRLEIGLSRKARTKKIAWQWGAGLEKPNCGCWMLFLGPFYFTWTSSGPHGCYKSSVVHLKKRSRKPKKGGKS